MTAAPELPPLPTFTPIQTRVYDLLSDGQLHSREELEACVDELAVWPAPKFHVVQLRKAIVRHRLDIICQLIGRRSYYRMVSTVVPRLPGPLPIPQRPVKG